MIENISRYIAIGDSFSEGLWDPYPKNSDLQQGWTDRLAQTISKRRTEQGLTPLEYANHAIRGKLLGEILEDQLPLALSQQPDLISIIGGGNDILRPGSDPDLLSAQVEQAAIAARKAGAYVLLGTGMDPIDLPIVRRTREKVAVYNANIWSIAQAQGTAALDMWGLHALRHEEMWAHDRIHLSPLGHHRVSQAALAALHLPVDDPNWRQPLPRTPKSTSQALNEHRHWMAEEVAPWVGRRLTGRSSGDARSAKYPTPTPVTPSE